MTRLRTLGVTVLRFPAEAVEAGADDGVAVVPFATGDNVAAFGSHAGDVQPGTDRYVMGFTYNATANSWSALHEVSPQGRGNADYISPAEKATDTAEVLYCFGQQPDLGLLLHAGEPRSCRSQ